MEMASIPTRVVRLGALAQTAIILHRLASSEPISPSERQRLATEAVTALVPVLEEATLEVQHGD